MKRRSKYSTGGGGKKREDAARDPHQADQSAPQPAAPFAGRPLDGSQYVDVIEEQRYAEQRPTQEEQRPRRMPGKAPG
jgi:hypothetical protein